MKQTVVFYLLNSILVGFISKKSHFLLFIAYVFVWVTGNWFQAVTLQKKYFMFIIVNKFSNINHDYLISSKSSSGYAIPKSSMKLTNFANSMRSWILWNTILVTILKEIEILALFKRKVNETLLLRDNTFFLF